MQAFRTLLPFIKKQAWYYLGGLFSLILVDTVNLFFPQVLRKFTNLAMANALSKEKLLGLALTLIGMGLAMALGRIFWRLFFFGMGPKAQYWLREKIYAKYLSLDERFYQERTTGDLMAHAGNDVFQVGIAMGSGVLMLVDSILVAVFCISMMIATAGILDTAIALSALPLIALALSMIMRPLAKRNRQLQNSFSDLTTDVQEKLSGIRVIKATGSEAVEEASFEEVNQAYYHRFLRLQRMDVLFEPAINFVAGLSFILLIIYSSYRIWAGYMMVGDFVALVQYMDRMIWPLVALGLINSRFQRALASMERINEILASESRVQEVSHPMELESVEGRIAFRHVYFRYDQDLDWVLEDVSFEIPPGSSFAILGRTGVGKSTILSLLLRQYDIQQGQILLDGVDIRKLSFASLYRAFSYVPQTSVLFSGTIGENIAFGDPHPDPKRIVEAAEFAQVDTDIAGMEAGYQSLVGERGLTLSGGQKQRISIARAYYRDAPVLILDDALSAVDTETEEKILHHIRQRKKSVLLVSQRVSTVQEADQIIVLGEGKIRQSGIHADLVQEEGFYKDLYERQLLESQAEERREG